MLISGLHTHMCICTNMYTHMCICTNTYTMKNEEPVVMQAFIPCAKEVETGKSL